MVIMHPRWNPAIITGILLVTFVLSLAAYPYLPDRIVSHWGISGEPDGSLPKAWGLFIVPLISAGIALLLLAIPRIDPLRANIAKFRPTYEHFIAVFLLYLLYIQLLVILWNFGVRFNFSQVLSPAFGALFYAIGILVGRAKQNWFIGIRTPWTLSSEEVWDRTHTLGGKLFRIAGVLALLGTLAPPVLAFLFILGPILVISVYLVVFSYLEYRKEEAAPRPAPGSGGHA
jgi:uncharacterized membrane protein